MSLFQQATDLNNKGVQSLLQGDATAAIDMMGKAIKLMRADLATEDLSRKDKDESSTSSLQDIDTVKITNMESSETIVFNQAVRIPANLQLTAFEKNVYTSAAVYNYALAHQFKGNAEASNKAEKLYGMVLKMLGPKTLTANAAIIVNLACINNLTQIRYSQGDYDKAREGFKQVSRFVRTSTNQAMLEEPEIQALIMSVLLLKAPVVATAA